MTSHLKAATTLLSGVLGVSACGWLAAPTALAQEPTVARVRWLVELGAESLVAAPRPGAITAAPLVVSVPGAAYVFDRESDGRLRKRARLPADSAAANGTAVAGRAGLVLADRLGAVSRFAVSPGAELSLRWRRELGERVTSIGWDGGPLVFAATWSGRLTALSAEDGRPAWSVDIGGRAEAPPVSDGRAVFVATKAKALVRIETATGVVRWKVALGGVAFHAPSLLGEQPRLVLCGTWDGQLAAYQALTGRLSWSAPLGAKLAGATLVAPGLVAVVTVDGAVRGYDLTGHVLWTAPGAAFGPATLFWQESAGTAPRLLSVSRVLVGLDPSTGERLADYPRGAVDELQRRFADAMLEGVKTYSEAEKQAIQEQEAFEIAGPLFGPARVFVDPSGASFPQLAFGSEEGWAYLFDATALRPLARYHAGPPSHGAPRLAGGRVVATAGEDVYALDAQTGAIAWRRTVGGEPEAIVGDATLGARAGGRVHAIAAADGSLGWSLKGDFRFLAPAADEPEPSGTPWLADDGAGNLRALAAPGRFVGDPLPVKGELLAVLATGARSWLAATRDGKLLGVAWEDASAAGATTGEPVRRLVTSWEKAWSEPLVEVQVAAGRALVRSVTGTLVSVDLATQQESWRLTLSKDDRVLARPQSGAVLILGAEALRVHDAATGELKHQQTLSLPALAADVRGELPPAVGLPFGGGLLRWLDRLGRAHQARLGSGRAATTDLGVTLAEAAPVEGGFLVTTAAGEVGFVEFNREE
jgi:outer membrane protein assembly factor BamB